MRGHGSVNETHSHPKHLPVHHPYKLYKASVLAPRGIEPLLQSLAEMPAALPLGTSLFLAASYEIKEFWGSELRDHVSALEDE